MARATPLVSLVVAIVLAAGATARERQPPAPALARTASVKLSHGITSLAALNRSPAVVAGLTDGSVVMWNGRDPAPSSLKPHETRVLAVGSAPDGREVLSVASDGSLARTGTASGSAATMRRVDLGAVPTRAAAFSTDGAMLVTGGEFGEIRVFDTATSALRQQLRGHRTELQDLAVRPGSAIVASASAESDLRIWDTSTGRELGFVDSDLSIFALAFSPRDGALASGGVDRRLTLRDPATFKPTSELALQAPRMVASLAWSPDGRLLAVGDLDDLTLSKGGIQIIEAASRAVVAVLDTGGVPASRVAFVADGGVVVAILGRELHAWAIALSR
jgi:WD40 repeat protein